MIDRVSSYVVHAALGIVAVIMLPIALAVLPFWLVGKALGAWVEAKDHG
jgi:hypothetical protein